MYGHESQPSRVYSFGAKPPKGADAELIGAQIDAGWRYRNDLVARELDRRAEADRIIREHYPTLVEYDAEIADAEAAIEGLRGRVRRANAASRAKDPSPESRATLRDMRATLKGLRAEHRALRRTAYADEMVRSDLATLDAHDLAERKRLRAESGLHWGSYLAIEQSLSGIRRGAPPRFVRRADWGGQCVVQVQGGATWDALVAGHGQCRVEVEPLPEHATPGGRRSRRPYCRLYMRVGSEGPGNRTPIWASVRFVLHRAVPADGAIKWARIQRARDGTRETWTVQLVVSKTSWAHQDTSEAAGACALNLGWRSETEGIRVAYAVGSDGHREEVWLPESMISGMAKADSLESIRDREYTLIRAALGDWLAVEDCPDWLREATTTLAQWRAAQARLASVAIRWRDARFAGDAAIYERVEAWRKQDRHLCDWAAAERTKFGRRRRETYRRFAARLRWRYETVVVESTDYHALAAKPVAEEDVERVNTRRNARLAAPGLLREIIESGHPDVVRADGKGGRPDTAGITTTCSICGSDAASDWDRIAEIEYRCASGHRLDQDRNAAANLLARHARGGVVSE